MIFFLIVRYYKLMYSNCNLCFGYSKWVECMSMAWETRVQSQVESYQRLQKWYLISPCFTLSIIRYVSKVKWSNPGKGVAPSPTPQCSSYWKGSPQVTLNYGHQLLLYTFYKNCNKDSNPSISICNDNSLFQ